MDSDMQRVTIPAASVRRMAALHRERVELDARATTYLTGLADALGLDVERIAGVDDASSELLLLPLPEPADEEASNPA